jgi:transposase
VPEERLPGCLPGQAVQRPATRCVPVKTDHQLDLQALHRVRSHLISDRTAVINQIRSFLLERGIPVRQGLRFLRRQLPDLLVHAPTYYRPVWSGLLRTWSATSRISMSESKT